MYCWLKYTAVFVMIDTRQRKRNLEVKDYQLVLGKFTSRYWTAHIHLLFAVHIKYAQEMKSSDIMEYFFTIISSNFSFVSKLSNDSDTIEEIENVF
jgi:hypothetical protein